MEDFNGVPEGSEAIRGGQPNTGSVSFIDTIIRRVLAIVHRIRDFFYGLPVSITRSVERSPNQDEVNCRSPPSLKDWSMVSDCELPCRNLYLRFIA